ncbi:serine/threonine protein kinase [Microcoleus sp. FACHB-53]|nr:serine/threonine protein kinase [Microcoleus sp. FACHB-53]MBD2128143.1 serine/threonine protein kinase [Microcoleus sp. FACHB-1]
MNFAPGNLSSFHSDVLQQTQLGQLCGQQQLFRNRYEVLRMLGRGGFGVTFLAKDVLLPSEPLCVIKQLCPKVADPSALENAQKRFEREAKILGKLGSHSQIPRLLDYFIADGEFYLVQEYVRGSTLARLVRRSGCFSEEWVTRFLREMLVLLQYVHKQQVIHRDIKPQNIIRCQDDGRLVLIDFGAVKELVAQAGETSMKAPTTHFIGTVGFAPPEQFSLRPVFGSDIYALGITCLYLLTGKAPLDFDSDRHTGELLWQNSAQVSEPFAKVLSKMLKISLSERYQSVGSILRALDHESTPDNLARCLLTRHQPDPEALANRNETSTHSHHSPAAKAAIAIRDWKYRMQARQQQRQKDKINHLLSESNNSK